MTPADAASNVPPSQFVGFDQGSIGWVDRCVCHDITFARVLGEIPCADASPESTAAALEAAAERFGCGRTCGMCRPYLTQAFAQQRPRIPLCE